MFWFLVPDSSNISMPKFFSSNHPMSTWLMKKSLILIRSSSVVVSVYLTYKLVVSSAHMYLVPFTNNFLV